jgi:hypothetical protein
LAEVVVDFSLEARVAWSEKKLLYEVSVDCKCDFNDCVALFVLLGIQSDFMEFVQ